MRAAVIEGSQGAGRIGGKQITGRMLDLSDAAITIETSPDRPPVVLSRKDVAGLEVSLRRSRRKKGALIGLAVGAAIGTVIMAADNGHDSCPPLDQDFLGVCRSLQEAMQAPGVYVAGALFSSAAGAGIGALIAPGEKWERVTRDRLRVAVAPTRGGGVRFGMSLAF